MIDVGRQNRPSFGYLPAYKFRSNVSVDTQFLTVHVFADSHIFHFRSDDTLFGICHLGDMFPGFGPVGQCDVLKAERVEAFVVPPHPSVFRTDLRKLLYIPPFQYPFFP